MKPRIRSWRLATICTMVIAIAIVTLSWSIFPADPPQDLRSEFLNDSRKEQEQLLSERWKPFTSEQLCDSLTKQRVAVIWIGYEFSFRAEAFEAILGPPIEGVDYYRHLVEWSKPKTSPFYEDFGVPKDGAIIIDALNGERTIITLGDEKLRNIRQVIRDSVLSRR